MGASTPAILQLKSAGVEFSVHSYRHDPQVKNFGEEAAIALDVARERVFKTLVVSDYSQPRNLAVGIVPVSGSLNLKAIAKAMGVKRATMAQVENAERTTGYVAGGISPIAQRKLLPTFLDHSAQLHPTIFVSAGARGIDIELSPTDLIAVTQAHLAPISERETSLN